MMNRYKYHDICRFRGVTAVYGIDVNYGMLEVRPCAMLDMRPNRTQMNRYESTGELLVTVHSTCLTRCTTRRYM